MFRFVVDALRPELAWFPPATAVLALGAMCRCPADTVFRSAEQPRRKSELPMQQCSEWQICPFCRLTVLVGIGWTSVAENGPYSVGWPTQARLWLEWGCSDPNFVVPTGADYGEHNHLRSGGTVCFGYKDRSTSSWNEGKKKTRTSRRKILSSRRTAPLKPKPGLNGPPVLPRRTALAKCQELITKC